MKTKELLIKVILTFILTFAVTSVVTLLWNLYIGKTGAIVDWKTSFVFAIILGLVIPIVQRVDKAK
jgi:hypothetical protein